MFAIRCEMNDLPSNYGEKTNCEMGCKAQVMSNEHILNCPELNYDTSIMNETEILNGNNKQKLKTLKKFKENMHRRTEYLRDSV